MDGTSIHLFPVIAAIFFQLDHSATPASPAHLCGLIRPLDLYYPAVECRPSPWKGKRGCSAIQGCHRRGGSTPTDRRRERRSTLESITGYNEAQTAARRVATRNGTVLSGIDVLEAHNFDPLRSTTGKKRIGLLTNQTGVDSQGRRTIDILAQAPGISLDAIFSPEHGVTGAMDTTDIANSKDAATGVPVFSVYGAKDADRRPPAEVLKNLDAIVFDVHDVGTRFYTYETTLGYFLEAAAKADIEIFVLDRPNPITGSFVQGAISDPGHESFTNYFPIPVRHGMTMGELAKMFNGERNLNAGLTVVPMEGWMRGDWYDSTTLPWINPSPNMRSLTEATLYPGVGLVEGDERLCRARHRHSF